MYERWDKDRRSWIYDVAIAKWGKEGQTVVVIEELSEAQKELCKFLRGKGNIDHLAEEVADAFIMLEQVVRMYGITDEVAGWMDSKLDRLSDRTREDMG